MKRVTFNLDVCIYTFDETEPIIKKKSKFYIFEVIKNFFFKK
jgi:hypothetical protein